MIVIIDYDMGNIGSVANMLKKLNVSCKISRNPEDIQAASKIILPGVGSFDGGVKNLMEFNLVPILRKKVLEEKTPILGICLGAQLLLERSEEGELPGLAFLSGYVKKFRFDHGNEKLRVPYMGWSLVQKMKENPLLEGINEETRFYFVHSYHFELQIPSDELLRSTYGYSYCSAFANNNIFGVQFHPEKSHKHGMNLLKNFSESF